MMLGTPRFPSLNLMPCGPNMPEQPKPNLLHISWHDSMWIPHLNSSNILEYFSERANPFYSRDCNNEFIKMQQNTRVDQLTNMQGVEYMLLHTQEPILYIIRKQHRYTPTQVSPLNNYHIIGGQVFQTPDLGSIVNSRVLATLNNLTSAFTELQSYSHYHPSRGYWWQFRNQPDQQEQQKKKEAKKPTQTKKEERASHFQNHRVNALLKDLHDKFPYKNPIQPAANQAGSQQPLSQAQVGQQQQQQPPQSQPSQPQSQPQQQQQQAQQPQQQPPAQQQQQQQQQQPQQQQQQQSQPPSQQQQQAPQQQQQSQPQQQQPQPQSQQSQPPQSQQSQQSGAQQSQTSQQQDASKTATGEDTKPDIKVEIKQEIKQEPGTQPAPQRSVKPPPEKRQRTTP